MSDICIRCGKCCIYESTDGEILQCKNFIKTPHENFCAIYHTRLGYELSPGLYCNERKNVETDYPDCPYNSGKPIHQAYKKSYCWKC